MRMKNLFFALLAMAATVAYGNDNPGMAVISKEGSGVFKVIYKGTTTGRIKLNILNDRGKTIHSETLTGLDGFIYPLNFKRLQSGDYTIELIDEQGRHREKVAFLPSHDIKRIHVSKLQNEEGKFLLAIAKAQNEPIRVKVYDGNGKLLYSETKILKGDFAQVYKIEGFHKRYTFEVSDDAGNKKYFAF